MCLLPSNDYVFSNILIIVIAAISKFTCNARKWATPLEIIKYIHWKTKTILKFLWVYLSVYKCVICTTWTSKTNLGYFFFFSPFFFWFTIPIWYIYRIAKRNLFEFTMFTFRFYNRKLYRKWMVMRFAIASNWLFGTMFLTFHL